MPMIKVRPNEPVEIAVRRFKRSCEKAGIIADIRKHEFYEKPKWVKKRKAAQAIKRLFKALARDRMEPVRGSGGATRRRSRGRKTRGRSTS